MYKYMTIVLLGLILVGCEKIEVEPVTTTVKKKQEGYVIPDRFSCEAYRVDEENIERSCGMHDSKGCVYIKESRSVYKGIDLVEAHKYDMPHMTIFFTTRGTLRHEFDHITDGPTRR